MLVVEVVGFWCLGHGCLEVSVSVLYGRRWMRWLVFDLTAFVERIWMMRIILLQG